MINYEKLLKLMGGDHSLADKLIQSFKVNSAELGVHMTELFKRSEYALLSNTAHILKTQAGYLGLKKLHNLCKDIEYYSRNNLSPDDLESRITELRILLDEILSREPFNN